MKFSLTNVSLWNDKVSVRARTDTLDAVVAALKAAGVIFVEENGEGPGVRLRKRIPAAPFKVAEFRKVIDEFERTRFENVLSGLELLGSGIGDAVA